MQELTLPVAPPASRYFSSGTPCQPNIRSICQMQIEQLAAQLPLIGVWIVYHDLDSNQYQSIVHYNQAQSSWDKAIFSPLESRKWWSDSLPVLRVSKLAIELENSINVYVCPLSAQESNREYLLIFSEESLSLGQQQGIEQQSLLLSHYLAIYQECFRQQEKVWLLEQAVQRVEHQLRNPLALISLYAEILYLQLPQDCGQEYAKLIRETANQTSDSLQALVHCGYQAKLEVAPHDLQLILIESIKGAQVWLDEKQLQVCYPSSHVTLAVDRWQMKQVFDNLLSNAVHFSPVNGTITCHWQVFHNEVLVEVRDRGPGLSETALKKAFTPFYSCRPGGTGLGLAIAKKIILDHRGSIWVQNLKEGGAQFSFTLAR